jgi:Tol biopolymer transport system component
VAGLLLVALAVTGGLRYARRDTPAQPRFLPVSAQPGNEHDPAVSPDGRRIAFAWDQGRAQPSSLYSKQVGDDSPLRLTDEGGDDQAPAWSPDGTQLGFVRVTAAGCELRSVPAGGGASRRLAACLDPQQRRFAWTPDARGLLLRGPREGGPGAGLHVLDLASQKSHALPIARPGTASDGAPAYSPDGRRVAFVREHGAHVGDIYLVDAAGGTPQRLTHDESDVRGVTWIAAGTQLVFASDRGGVHGLWSVAATGGTPVLVAGGRRGVSAPTASFSGNVIGYEAWSGDWQIWRQPASGAAGAPVSPAAGAWSFDARFAPDGRQIAFVSNRSGSDELWLCNTDGSGIRRLTSFEAGSVRSPRFSPDGRRVAFVARPRGGADVYVADVAGGPLRWLTQAPGDEVAPAFSADGRWVYYGSHHADGWQLRKHALDSSHDVATGVRGYAAQESRDGRWLYFTRIEQAGLWRVPAAGGGEALVTADLAAVDWASWGSAEAGVHWTARDADGRARVLLWRPGADGPETLAGVPDPARPGIDVDGTASTLLYSRATRLASDIGMLTLRP